MKKPAALLLALFCFFVFLVSPSQAEQATSEPIPEPTLSPNAEKYDADHPENLSQACRHGISGFSRIESAPGGKRQGL